MATARRNWLTALIGEDPNAPHDYWNVPGVNPDKERIAWEWRVSVNKGFHQGRAPINEHPTSAAAWVEAVIGAEAVWDINQPKRFGEGDWQPPLTLKGISVLPSNPRAWRATYSVSKTERFKPQLAFDPNSNDPEKDKKHQWDKARETLAQMKNGSYKPQSGGRRKEK